MAIVTNEGSKKWYKYVNDKDTPYAVLLDADFAALGGFVELTSADGAVPEKPRRLKMRKVYYKAVDPASKYKGYVYCADIGNTASSTKVGWNMIATALTVNGVSCVTTGRTGEKYSFPIFSSSGS